MKEPGELRGLLESIRCTYGYDFTEYAELSMKRRISDFMVSNKFNSLGALGKALLREEVFFEQFIQEVTVNVTEMFRNPGFYQSLRKNIVLRLATYPFLKIWIAGSSTGEELYSLAILLKEEGLLERSVIYATDINQKALQSAREGIYSNRNIQHYAENYLKSGGKAKLSDYYKAKYDAILLDRSLKHNVVFAFHNLAVDRSFNEFQLILCRNVLIYFSQSLQNKVLNLIYDSLCPFGYLGLGSKESLLCADRKKAFEEVDAREKIYVKTA
jgi:chemotaxis protein methyltransferase CheR